MNPEKTGSMFKTNSPHPNNKDVIQFSDRPSFNFPVAIAWLVALFSILGTLFFWWVSRDSASMLEEKKTEKTNIIGEILSPTYVDVEKKASSFKSSVNALSDAAKDRYPTSQFLKDLYTKITKDVVITSLSVGADGSVSISGKTDSYRSVADLVVALKSWDTLTNVDLGAVSYEAPDKTKGGNPKAVFSITAKINKAKSKKTSYIQKNNYAMITVKGGTNG